MIEENPVIIRMDKLLSAWEAGKDRRLIFLHCYRMMTENINTAISTGYFEDNSWINKLMENFAGYYFHALEAYESQSLSLPVPWQIAFKASNNTQTHVLQNLMLGINAHINYDLVFALSDILTPEWAELSGEQRQMRYRDHNRVNEVIHQTINAVQDQVVDRFEPVFGVIDTLLGPLDEWMTSLFISRWREEVWEHAVLLIESSAQTSGYEIVHKIEKISFNRAMDILGRGNLPDLAELL
jgi:hypothetical protein